MDGERPLLDEGPLAQFGEKLIENGYKFVPLIVGEKRPKLAGWTKIDVDEKILKGWLRDGHKKSGLGILTRDTPAIDIDVRDAKIAEQMEAIAREIFGDAPLRIGLKPKRLLVYRADTPFKKMTSAKYVDMLGDMHQIEILADGQQFAAYHKHPDTGRPYTWPNGDGPTETPVDDLPTITPAQCQEFIDRFEEIAKSISDWEVAESSSPSRRHGDKASEVDEVWTSDGRKVEMTMDELRNRLMLIPADMGYQDWVNVGMALYHHSDGDAVGLEIWHEWSGEFENYDAGELDEKWDGFSISDKPGLVPITATFILARSKDAVEKTSARLEMELKDQFTAATDIAQWKEAQQKTRESEIDMLARSSLVELAKKKLDLLKGTATPISEVRKALAYSPKGEKGMPNWMEPWVYDISEDRFYNSERKTSASKQGFDMMYNRQALTKKDLMEGKTQATMTASMLASNFFSMPMVEGQRYEPGEDPIFTDNGSKFANTYAEHEIPQMPEKFTPRDKKAIERIKNHIRHLLVNPVERRILLDWLSWVVQNPGKHVNWAILLQGTEGDGKSFFAIMMRDVMGVSNVRMLSAQSLERDFTDWAVGQCLTCIEEVRLINPNNKYEVLNKIKPYITNNVVEVHPKGGKQYNGKNTTSYLLFSNFRDALPLGENGRRYCILFSQYQTMAMLSAFRAQNPDYYTELYAATEQCAPAIRKWLLNREISADFQPFGDAPATDARKYMIREAQPEMIQALDDVIEEGENPLISTELVDIDVFKTEMASRGVEVFKGKGLAAALARHDFEFLGRVKIEGVMRNFYSKQPEMWRWIGSNDQVHVDFDRIRQFVKKHEVDPLSSEPDDDEL